jgi:flagellar hook assembly protein FlgD
VAGLRHPSRVVLAVYDSAGRLIRLLADRHLGPGHFLSTWDCSDRLGRSVPTGAYFLHLTVDSRSHTRPVLLVQ